MRLVPLALLVASSAFLESACSPSGSSGGQITQATDASNGSDALVTNDSSVTTTTTTTTSDPADTSTTSPSDTFQPPGDTSQPPGDTVSPTGRAVGAACTAPSQCAGGARAMCLGLPGGYCTLGECDTQGCPDGSSCWGIGDSGSVCIQDCTSPSQCRTGEGYVCDADDTCWFYDDTPGGTSPVGGPCEVDEDCKDAGAFCYPEIYDGENTGFVGGYCMIPECTAQSCPAGSTCQAVFADGGKACVDSCGTAGNGCNLGYACYQPGICFPGCESGGCPANYACDAESDSCLPACTPASCTGGTVCKADGRCGPPPCTANSCGVGYECAPSGDCVPDLDGGPGPGPGPTCNNHPPRDCTSNCFTLTGFEPDEGPGYWDYPINGETTANEYRSFANGHLQALIKWATAMVDCKAAGWSGGNGKPLGLGDMSEANGDIPGTSIGQPGHPSGTHEDGLDMDIAYYQVTSADNKLRPICAYANEHCSSAPNNLDLWRQAYILGLVMQSPRVRVIGVDGQVGPLVEQAMDVLCGNGWLTGRACTNPPLAYETTDGGAGWFYFHHHHWHISTYGQSSMPAPSLPGQRECLTRDCTLPEAGPQGCVHGEVPELAVPRVERPLRLVKKTRITP